MLFVAVVALLFGYAVIYSGVQTLRGGWSNGPRVKVGILECLTPGFDPVALEQRIAQAGGTQQASPVTGNTQPAQGQAQQSGAKPAAPVIPPSKKPSVPISILPPL